MSLEGGNGGKLYAEFMDYKNTLSKDNQRLIQHVRDFFESDEKFIGIFCKAHKTWEGKRKELTENSKKILEQETDKKRQAQIKRKIAKDAKQYADRHLIYRLEQIDSEKFKYHMHKELPNSAFALFLNFLKTKKTPKLTPHVDNEIEIYGKELLVELEAQPTSMNKDTKKTQNTDTPPDLFGTREEAKKEQREKAESLKQKLKEGKSKKELHQDKGREEIKALEGKIKGYQDCIDGLETPICPEYEEEIKRCQNEIERIEKKYGI